MCPTHTGRQAIAQEAIIQSQQQEVIRLRLKLEAYASNTATDSDLSEEVYADHDCSTDQQSVVTVIKRVCTYTQQSFLHVDYMANRSVHVRDARAD